MRRAQIRILGPDIGSKSAMTDGEGRYEFRDLPAGRFNMTATKAGYVTISYGQTRPFETGRPIDLTEGQLMDKADFSMPRGSAISGRLVDEFGLSLVNASGSITEQQRVFRKLVSQHLEIENVDEQLDESA